MSVSLPGFELLDTIGSGSICTVFRAKPADSSKPIAIKLVRPECEQDILAVEHLRGIATLGRSLEHSNIVRVLKHGSIFTPNSKPPYWYAVELFSGPTLSQLIAVRHGEPLREAQICQIGIPICAALDFAHNRKPPICHRNINPSNIAIELDGTVKLMDFGVATSPAERTKSGRLLPLSGKAEYMWPEAAMSDLVDARSDLYSLGIVLYELATGRLPLSRATGDTDQILLERHARENPPTPRELCESLSTEMDRVIRRLLARDPNERFQSAGTLRQVLSRHLREIVREDPADVPSLAVLVKECNFQPIAMDSTTASAKLAVTSPRQATGRRSAKPAKGKAVLRKSFRLGMILLSLLLVVMLAVALFVPGLEKNLPVNISTSVPRLVWTMADDIQTKIFGGRDQSPPKEEPPVTTEEVKPADPLVQVTEKLQARLNDNDQSRRLEAVEEFGEKFRIALELESGDIAPTELLKPGGQGDHILELLFQQTSAILVKTPVEPFEDAELRLTKIRTLLQAAYRFHAWRLSVSDEPTHLNGQLWKLEQDFFNHLMLWCIKTHGLVHKFHLAPLFSSVFCYTNANGEQVAYLVPAFLLGENEISKSMYNPDYRWPAGQEGQPIDYITFTDANTFAQNYHLTIPTYLMWRIVVFAGDDNQGGWDPNDYILTTSLEMADVRTEPVGKHVKKMIRFGTEKSEFFHLIGNTAEWIRMSAASRDFLEDSGRKLEPEASGHQYYCGFAQGDNPLNANIFHNNNNTDGLLPKKDGEGAANVGFRCALELVEPIRLPHVLPSPDSAVIDDSFLSQ